MKHYLSILLLLCTSSNVFSQCEELDGSWKMLRVFKFNQHVSELAVPNKANMVTEKYINTLNNYISLTNSYYRPNEFHSWLNKIIENESEAANKAKLIKAYSIYKHFDENLKNDFIELAEQKYTKSLYCLGRIYEHGIGVEISYTKAWAWYNTAFAVEGIKAKSHIERVWKHLNWQDEIEAKKYSDQYTYLYTNLTSTPSTTIIR